MKSRTTNTSVYVDSETRDRLTKLAQRQRRSRAEVLRILIEEAEAEAKAQEQAA